MDRPGLKHGRLTELDALRGIVSRVDGMADMDHVTSAIAAILDGSVG